jgi:hypothetical protein
VCFVSFIQEFPAEGKQYLYFFQTCHQPIDWLIQKPLYLHPDWPESSTTLAALTSANTATGAGQPQDPSAQLWEDNWDDDDKELPFTQQLR